MKIYNDIEQNTPEWFELRKGKFTCSDAHIISVAGKGLETLVFEKVAEILSSNTEESYDNDNMRRGRELEELARNQYELETMNIAIQIGLIEFNENIAGSPDSLINNDGIIEIKCPTNRVYIEYLYNEKIDPKYRDQMQMLLYISGREWCDYVVFNPDFSKNIKIVRIFRDDEIIEKIKIGIEKAITMKKEILSKIGGVQE